MCAIYLVVLAAELYELTGAVAPPGSASVSLHGATNPFSASTLAGVDGRFRFRNLEPGTYTLSAFSPRRGEARRTIEISPSLADSKRRVRADLALDENPRGTVAARELAIPAAARREYNEAQKKLSRRDVAGATGNLERALEIEPGFTAARNNLGTIAYQTRRFADAEAHFREALERDPGAYEPLVNLGGVLLTLLKIDEALDYNLHAMLNRPGDALANSQLGMNYLAAGNLDLARKYLEIARRIDPAHFSHPQLSLADIHSRRGDLAAAAAELEDFLRRHPDSPQAGRVRALLGKLK
ncbi:MAG: tetratricopeptide repeat protein [Bryobacteraceae bacterium]